MKSCEHAGHRLARKIGRPVIVGEFPYYRLRRDQWEQTIAALKGAGITVLSVYVPWRFHLVDARQSTFDFFGREQPQTNLAKVLDLAAQADLQVFLKPGPFIHAEVELGGLPDYVSDEDRFTKHQFANGQLFLSQGRPLPSIWCPQFRSEIAGWYETLFTFLREQGRSSVVAAVQVGNEGIYSDANLPIDNIDTCSVAESAYADWLGGEPEPIPAMGERSLSNPRATAWYSVSLASSLEWLRSLLPEEFQCRAYINYPLGDVAGSGVTSTWHSRARCLRDRGLPLAHTEWVGNPSTRRPSFASHLYCILLGGTSAAEANWGFTWNDLGYARPETVFFNAVLDLILGSATVSLYTSVVAESWPDSIAMSESGLRQEGENPQDHWAPYCPGAPLTSEGMPGTTYPALASINQLLAVQGQSLLDSELVCQGWVLIEANVTALQERQIAQAIFNILATTGHLIAPVLASRSEASGLVFSSSDLLGDPEKVKDRIKRSGSIGSEFEINRSEAPPSIIEIHRISHTEGTTLRAIFNLSVHTAHIIGATQGYDLRPGHAALVSLTDAGAKVVYLTGND